MKKAHILKLSMKTENVGSGHQPFPSNVQHGLDHELRGGGKQPELSLQPKNSLKFLGLGIQVFS